jgi:hypothetical protein
MSDGYKDLGIKTITDIVDKISETKNGQTKLSLAVQDTKAGKQEDGKYPTIWFSALQSKSEWAAKLAGFSRGDRIAINGPVSRNETNGAYYINAWNVYKQVKASDYQPTHASQETTEADDEIPF